MAPAVAQPQPAQEAAADASDATPRFFGAYLSLTRSDGSKQSYVRGGQPGDKIAQYKLVVSLSAAKAERFHKCHKEVMTLVFNELKEKESFTKTHAGNVLQRHLGAEA